MIVIKQGKELIRVEHWADVIARPGFRPDLDPKQHTLREAIGRYGFADRIACGLSSCHQKHQKGYVVATVDGFETNIGQDCGRTYFGIDWETMTRKFDDDLREKENRDKLWTFSFALPELKQRVDGMLADDLGGRAMYRLIRPFLEGGSGVPADVQRKLGNMVRTRSPWLLKTREATEAEIERIEVAQGRSLARPHYIDEPDGVVDGLEALYPENDLKTLLVIELQEQFKAFEHEDIDAMTFSTLNRWAKWVGTVDATLDRAEAALAWARAFLQNDNLRQLGDFDHLKALPKPAATTSVNGR